MKPERSTITLVCCVVLAACDSGGGARRVMDQPASTHVRHSAEAKPDGSPLQAMEVLRIGAADAAGGHAFGRVRGLLLDSSGRVYVLDAMERAVTIFGADGSVVRTFGRAGGGPGEFNDPRGMVWGPDSTLWIMDFANQRYTVFDRAGDPVATVPRQVPASGTDWQGFVDPAGALYDVAFATRGGAGGSQVLVRFDIADSGPVPRDTIPLPPQPDSNYRLETAAGILSFGVPYAGRPYWEFDGRDALWIGSGTEYRLVRQRLSGDTVSTVTWHRPPEPVSARERRDARRQLEADLARLGGATGVVDFSRIPTHKPAHGRIRVDDSGNVWVQRPSGPAPRPDVPSSTWFDVFSDSGAYLGAVELPVAGALPMAFASSRVAGVNRDELGVQRVVVFAVTR